MGFLGGGAIGFVAAAGGRALLENGVLLLCEEEGEEGGRAVKCRRSASPSVRRQRRRDPA